MKPPEDLQRTLGLLDATAIVIGIVIGAGIFLVPGMIARELPSAAAILALWAATGVLSLFGALAYAELGAMMPDTGGQYVYLRRAFGPGCAFLCGWVFLLAVMPGGIAFLAVGFSLYGDRFVPLGPAMRTAVSLALVAILSAINYVGVRESAWVQRIFTSLKIGGLLLLIGAAAFAPARASAAVQAPAWPPAGIGLAVAACLMAYNGWSYVSFVAGEVRSPARTIPRSLALSMGVVIALYVLANAAYLRVMDVAEIAASERVGASFAERALGAAGADVLSAIVLCSIVGAVNGCILTSARIPFAQARDGMFFARFGSVHPRFRTPSFAIVVQGLWTGVLILSGSFEALLSYTILSAWIFYTLSVAAVWVLRRREPSAARPYRMWGYPYTLALFVVVSLWFMGDALVNQPRQSLAAFAITAAGVPFYYLWRRKVSPRSGP